MFYGSETPQFSDLKSVTIRIIGKLLLYQLSGVNQKFRKKDKKSVSHGLKLFKKGEICRKAREIKWKSKKELHEILQSTNTCVFMIYF